ncbi:MAG: dienelactone hydrolase, partial [Phormidesmis sp. CAN_BIN44]|nr:dienelactone hydrolase [Phormidesmis sp. CAN_BIN44]
RLLQGVSLAFIEQTTSDAKTYAPFLTSAYAQSLSTSDLPLRLNDQLPADLTRLFTFAALL